MYIYIQVHIIYIYSSKATENWWAQAANMGGYEAINIGDLNRKWGLFFESICDSCVSMFKHWHVQESQTLLFASNSLQVGGPFHLNAKKWSQSSHIDPNLSSMHHPEVDQANRFFNSYRYWKISFNSEAYSILGTKWIKMVHTSKLRDHPNFWLCHRKIFAQKQIATMYLNLCLQKQQQPCIQTRNLRAQKHLNGNPNHGKSLSRVSRGIFDRQRHGHMHAAELTVRENPGGSRWTGDPRTCLREDSKSDIGICQYIQDLYRFIWRCPRMGIPQIIHFRLGFSISETRNHPPMGVTPIDGNRHVSSWIFVYNQRENRIYGYLWY